ncbi:hypothetical protein SAMN02949497_3581 [Methylomagnum ishizawai]|uniref:Uncharacterized protein n=1 Tax=Methylomagnum ishizawai TaxID=1760988 RepID=A0A1Y6D0Q9_9GAMM|nr:hypothetical protein SAMN02949497_3581 [Methylomagnum ishizawai]
MYEQYRGKRVVANRSGQRGLVRQALPVPQRRASGIFAALAAGVLLAAVLVLFLQVQGFVNHLEAQWAADTGGDTRLRALNQHMEALQTKFNALLADSVEVRLKALEKSVESGKVALEDLRAFESLKNDLQTLEAYTERAGTTLGLDSARQEHGRYQPMAAGQAAALHKTDLKGELAELKTLFYGCLAALAVALLALARYWANQRRAIRQLELLATLPMLAGPPPSDRSR